MTDAETTLDLLLYDLSQCKSVPQTEAAQDRAFARTPHNDAATNTRIINAVEQRRKQIRER